MKKIWVIFVGCLLCASGVVLQAAGLTEEKFLEVFKKQAVDEKRQKDVLFSMTVYSKDPEKGWLERSDKTNVTFYLMKSLSESHDRPGDAMLKKLFGMIKNNVQLKDGFLVIDPQIKSIDGAENLKELVKWGGMIVFDRLFYVTALPNLRLVYVGYNPPGEKIVTDQNEIKLLDEAAKKLHEQQKKSVVETFEKQKEQQKDENLFTVYVYFKTDGTWKRFDKNVTWGLFDEQSIGELFDQVPTNINVESDGSVPRLYFRDLYKVIPADFLKKKVAPLLLGAACDVEATEPSNDGPTLWLKNWQTILGEKELKDASPVELERVPAKFGGKPLTPPDIGDYPPSPKLPPPGDYPPHPGEPGASDGDGDLDKLTRVLAKLAA